MMKNQKGFTLIELLVVIAIIGVLAGILFVAINPGDQIDKANDASKMATLAGVPAGALVSYDSADFSYANVCATTEAGAFTAQTISGVTCADDDDSYGAFITGGLDETPLNTYCVDSTGYRGELLLATATAAMANTPYTCQ